VVQAARDFVAIRPTSYENAKERDYLKALFVGRSGEVENTTFALLASDGKTLLSRVSRSPSQVFGNAQRMASAMKEITQKPGQPKSAQGDPVSPAMANVRLAVNVAACDNLPLVILGPQADANLEKALTRVFFESKLKGGFVPTRGTAAEMAKLEGFTPGEFSVAIVQPDPFGLKGKVFAQGGKELSPEQLETWLSRGLSQFQTSNKDLFSHRTEGFRVGAFWETALPVTDPQEKRARDRHPGAKK